MRVQDVQVLRKLLFLNHPPRQLVYFRLFLVLLHLQIVQKLLLLPVLVNNVYQLILQVRLLIRNHLSLAHRSIQLLPLLVDIHRLLF